MGPNRYQTDWQQIRGGSPLIENETPVKVDVYKILGPQELGKKDD